MVYPHSGTFNGTTTWLTAIVVGTGWHIFEGMSVADINTDGFDDIIAWDNDQEKSWIYLHSGTFDGTRTFRPALALGYGQDPWLFSTEWRRENADLVFVEFEGGDVIAFPHTNKFSGIDTWDVDAEWTVATGQFTRATTLCALMIDLNGDGKDDLVKSMPNGYLMYYQFRGWGQSPGLAAPVTGTAGRAAGWPAPTRRRP